MKSAQTMSVVNVASNNQQSDSPKVTKTRSTIVRSTFQTLKRVSGRLTRFLHLSGKKVEQVHRLLVIDDEESICLSIAEFFTHKGFKVDMALDYDEAERL